MSRRAGQGNPDLPLHLSLDGMKLYWICQYGRFFEKIEQRVGASSL